MSKIESSVIEERKKKVEFKIAEDLWKRYLATCEKLGAIPEEVLPLLIEEEINMQAARLEYEKMSEEEKARERLVKLKKDTLAAFEEIFNFMMSKK